MVAGVGSMLIAIELAMMSMLVLLAPASAVRRRDHTFDVAYRTRAQPTTLDNVTSLASLADTNSSAHNMSNGNDLTHGVSLSAIFSEKTFDAWYQEMCYTGSILDSNGEDFGCDCLSGDALCQEEEMLRKTETT